VDFETFQDVLKHPIRRKIVLTLNAVRKLSYMELMGTVEATNTGKFNYHLKVLADLIQKDEKGQYELTEKGHLAAQFLQTFKDKKQEPSSLRLSDALLIGFTGFVLTVGNPFFWAFMFAASIDLNSVPLAVGLEVSMIIFSMFVPGALMWRLAVRRTNSHDPYALFKAPLFTFAILLPLFIVMLIFHVTAGAQIQIQTSPTISSGNITLPNGATSSWSKTSYIMFPVSLFQLVFTGLFWWFLGVAIAELVSRVRKKFRLK
jgi:hypothetical protein